MAATSIDVASLVRTICEPLVEAKDELQIVQTEAENGDVLVEIRANEGDTGKIIGRQGRVIKSIRTLARAATTRDGVHVDVELVD